MKRTPLYMAMAGLTLSAAATFTQAQDQIEQIVVTGSYIAGSPEDAAVPIDVITSEDLAEVGSPSMVELIRNLGVTSGNIGESNQFQSAGGAGVATINLRGLGSARTLVLINGRRHVATQGIGVDLGAMPSIAIGRMEVLKDGAAALYGSDAMSGVVNFITRGGFEGLELRGSYQDVQDAGDSELGFIYGVGSEQLNWTFSAEYKHRDSLGIKDRDWALPTFAENPQGGFSGIGNPARILPAYAPSAGAILGAGGADPECTALGGVVDGTSCRFQYTYFDNLIEDEDTYKVFSELNWAIGDSADLHVEALYGKVEVDRLTSPSYPPQSLFGPDRFIAASHPGLVDFKSQYPTFFNAVGPFPAAAQGAFVLNRYAGVAGVRGGNPESGEREIEQYRLGASIKGAAFNDELNYDIGLTWSERHRTSLTDDMYVERMAFALDGLGGADCNQATGTAGVGPCMYFNPFSNAIERSAVTGVVNPNYNSAVANDPALLDWLTTELSTDTTSTLTVLDVVLSGDTGIELGGGTIGWAAGAQGRSDRFKSKPGDQNNVALNPCPFNDPQSVVLGNVASLSCSAETGLFAFLAAGFESDLDRRTFGAFTEFKLPITDNFEIGTAVRFEDYGGNVGSTVDPKITLRYQATDSFAVRASASTTFRGPAQSSLTGRTTALQFVAAANAFKAIDIIGNPDLNPESAVATNLGFILDLDNGFYGSLDWWRFDISDPFETESYGQVLSAWTASGCAPGGVGGGTTACNSLQSRVFLSPGGTSAASVERIAVNRFNGEDRLISGLDLFTSYTLDSMGGELEFGLEATYNLEYEFGDFFTSDGVEIGEGGDFVGFLNDGFVPTPLPQYKGNLFAKYRSDMHSVNLIARFVDGYEDATAPIPSLKNIDSHLTFDINYNIHLLEDSMRLSLSVFNITDEDPPQTATDLNYDAFTHSAFGRMIKLGVVYNLDI